MNPSGKSHVLQLLFTLTLFCVFAASSLLVVILGSRVYSNTISEMNGNYDLRTSLHYISEKLRQSDAAGSVRIGSFGDGDALLLDQTVDGTVYRTWIYQYDGSLCEIFAQKDAVLQPANGQAIMPLAGFALSYEEPGLLRVQTTGADGQTASLLLSPRCGV